MNIPKNRPAETATGIAGSILMILIWVGIDPVLAGALAGVLGYLPAAVTWLIVTWRTAGK